MNFSESRTFVRLKFNWGPYSPDPLGRCASNKNNALTLVFYNLKINVKVVVEQSLMLFVVSCVDIIRNYAYISVSREPMVSS